MVRAGLASRPGRLARGPRAGSAAIPAISVILASALSIIPLTSDHGWWPDAGLLMLLAWRMMRADAWPAWAAAPLGFVNDLLLGNPIGLSVALWTFIILAMDVIDRRTMWRDYWLEWALAGIFIALSEIIEWRIAAAMGAPVPFGLVWPAIIIGLMSFPIAAFITQRLDRWRLGR